MSFLSHTLKHCLTPVCQALENQSIVQLGILEMAGSVAGFFAGRSIIHGKINYGLTHLALGALASATALYMVSSNRQTAYELCLNNTLGCNASTAICDQVFETAIKEKTFAASTAILKLLYSTAAGGFFTHNKPVVNSGANTLTLTASAMAILVGGLTLGCYHTTNELIRGNCHSL